MVVSLFSLAVMHIFILLMESHSINWLYLSLKVVSILAKIMMTCAPFVQMVGIFCLVMDAQGPSTKVKSEVY